MKKGKQRILVAFDFDGTLTKRDTFFLFLRDYLSFRDKIILYLTFSPSLVLAFFHILSRSKVKEKMFQFCFAKLPLNQFNKLCLDFCERYFEDLVFKSALETIAEYKKKHNKILIVSASIQNWVIPFAIKLGIPATNVLATRVEVDIEGKLTGRFLGRNCKGAEKVRRLKEYLGDDFGKYWIVAYGDSSGDRELLSVSDEPYYRQFN